MTDDQHEVPPGGAARIDIVGGGTPGARELAALAVALTPTGGTGAVEIDRTPAWARAALLEGVGHRTPTRPSDLELATRLG